MATLVVGPASAGSANGTSWANRWGMAEFNAATLVAGNTYKFGPGVHRGTGAGATCTIPTSGGGLYTTGTVSVTHGSTTVTGSGTTFTGGNVAAGFVFQVPVIAHGTDGVTNGTATFTSAAGNFQAGMIGMTIRIDTKEAAVIGAVGSATSITLAKADGTAASPTAATALVYDVGPESPYDVASVTDATHLELTEPWSGPSLTGLAYRAFNPIRIIGDVYGTDTDGVGGIVRMTGSNDDLVSTRTSCITAAGKSYLVIQGFQFDGVSGVNSALVNLTTSCTDVIIQDCVFQATEDQKYGVQVAGATQARVTLRRCKMFMGPRSTGFYATHTVNVINVAHLVESSEFSGQSIGFSSLHLGGILIRNNSFRGMTTGAIVGVAPGTGQATTARQNVIEGCATGLDSSPGVNFMVEDYNNIYGCQIARHATGPLIGPNSSTAMTLSDVPLLAPGFGPREGDFRLGPWSTLRAKAALTMPATDLSGTRRPMTSAKNSWGPSQFNPMVRSTSNVANTTYSRYLPDAGSDGFWIRALNQTLVITVYREANYAGTAPQVRVRQPGQAETVVTDSGSAGAENALTVTLTPAAFPLAVWVELVSHNTATSGSYGVYWSL